ncbi:DNA polymerase I [Desulfitobacterium dichloroeliminans LMG P-21439]|uniref:DNA polymerase I n=1 Tax=Desulfitobacterium dichloroeliminans (strain LMG P-21439 / DCA1) TaxID=871963 RepID=L0F5K3_DESDL|nr:DNA polymerase I [Desulfitobacterium dichloroeliminans]AGA69094.1 DNA polymerase I [Desulfitobacterium dichloroeliminans LMG P-21439]
MSKILILDGNSLANRAFYALPVMTTADGKPTNVLHGFMTMLLRLLLEQKPDYWVVAFDKTKATVRIEQYAEYKAQRKETPEALKPQFDFLKELLTDFSMPILECADYEADDIIATVTSMAEKREWEVQIYTGDRDALQLVSPYTTVYLTRKGISEVDAYTEAALYEKYQLSPAQIIDLKGLMGDASDNIPGVPGVGEKTALKLLWEYASVENVLENIEKISGKKLQENLRNNTDKAILSKKLATMIYDVPLEIDLDKFAYRRPDEKIFAAALDKYVLKSVTRIWQEHHGVGVENNSTAQESTFEPWPLQELTTEEWVLHLQKWNNEKTPLTLAYANTEGNSHWANITGWGIAVAGESFTLAWTEVDLEVRRAFINLLEDPDVPKLVEDSKLLYTLLLNEEITMQGVAMDISLAAYLINPTRSKFKSLELVKEYIPGVTGFENLGEEASALAQVVGSYKETLEELGLNALLHEMEEPLSPILAQMEKQGIAVDVPMLEEFGQNLSGELKRLEEEIYKDAGETFNINSPQQLGHILFEKLGLPPMKKTKTGYSTDADTLEELRTSHPMVEKILDYRQLSKLMSTYVNGLLAQIREGRVHTTFQQTVAATGRLSSTEPNLQNIPIRLELGRLLRKVFKPTQEGWVLLSADYSQIELRILAHYSQDEVMSESFFLNQDVHTRTASEVFGVPMEEVTKDMRRKAKAVNFGLVYGLTEFGLGRDLGVPRKEAKDYIEKYFHRYEGVKRYLEEIVVKAKEEAQVRTLLNRLRRIPELRHPNRVQRQFGERIAMNTPIQGTAADIMKLAMLGVAQAIEPYRAHLLLQVHDELVIEVAPEELEVVAKIVREEMENAFPLSVPLTVECKSGPNWYDMENYFFAEDQQE